MFVLTIIASMTGCALWHIRRIAPTYCLRITGMTVDTGRIAPQVITGVIATLVIIWNDRRPECTAMTYITLQRGNKMACTHTGSSYAIVTTITPRRNIAMIKIRRHPAIC
jgi:hypothetical protein